MSRMKVKLADRLTKLSETWRSAQIVRTREKICTCRNTNGFRWAAHTHTAFLFGVSTLAATCLMWGLVPEWIPFAYTVQCGFYLPVRVYTYKRKAWHYFLFGTCRDV